MKLEKAIQIAEGVGLETVEESIQNIICHAANIFTYAEAHDELVELLNDMNSFYGSLDFDFERGSITIEQYKQLTGGK